MLLRAYTIRPIPRAQGIAYIAAHHYLKTAPKASSASYGLYAGAQLIGVALVGVGCSEAARAYPFGGAYRRRVLELTRFHVLDGTPRCTESWFLARVRRQLDHQLLGLLAFADPSAGHSGIIYRASNALYLGKTRARRAYQDSAGRTHSDRQGRATLSAAAAAARGWTAIRQAPKHRYLFLLGGPLQRHYARALVVAPILPYPTAAGPASRWDQLVQAAVRRIARCDARFFQQRLARHYYRRLGVDPFLLVHQPPCPATLAISSMASVRLPAA